MRNVFSNWMFPLSRDTFHRRAELMMLINQKHRPTNLSTKECEGDTTFMNWIMQENKDIKHWNWNIRRVLRDCIFSNSCESSLYRNGMEAKRLQIRVWNFKKGNKYGVNMLRWLHCNHDQLSESNNCEFPVGASSYIVLRLGMTSMCKCSDRKPSPGLRTM